MQTCPTPFGCSEVHGFGVEIDFFDFGVGSHHELLAPEESGAQHPESAGRFECGVRGALSARAKLAVDKG